VEHHFPWRERYLARTRLCYIDLDRLLSHAKRDRAARVSGYVQVELGDAVHLVFLDAGEPVNAATLRADRREVVPLAALLSTLAEEVERSEAGHVGFYGTDSGQLRAMFATVAGAPLDWATDVPTADLDRLFADMHRRQSDGILELTGGGYTGYLRISGGLARRFFVGQGSEPEGGAAALRRFVAEIGNCLSASLYPPVSALPAQAPRGLAELYATLLGEVARRLLPHLGDDELEMLFNASRPDDGAEDALAGFRRLADGVTPGHTTASHQLLTEAVGWWVVELAAAAADRTGMDPAELLVDAGHPYRFALEETGLLERLPWPLPWPDPES